MLSLWSVPSSPTVYVEHCDAVPVRLHLMSYCLKSDPVPDHIASEDEDLRSETPPCLIPTPLLSMAGGNV